MTNILVVSLFFIIFMFVCRRARLELKKMDEGARLKREKLLLRESLYDRLSKDKKFREEYLKSGLKTINKLEKNIAVIK